MFWNESIKGMGRPANSHRKYASIRGYFMANVDSEQDRYRVLEHPAWFMVNSGLTIQLWDINFDPRQELPTDFPVWVKLKFLPIFGSQSTSGRKFLEDRRRSGKTWLVQCVELDIQDALPEEIILKVPVGSNGEIQEHKQAFDYEQLPFKCNRCHQYGHFSRVEVARGESRKNRAGA